MQWLLLGSAAAGCEGCGMTFHIGQKVVCVDDSIPEFDDRKLLTRGAVYTVTEAWLDAVCLEEVTPEPVTDSFRANRFRPLDEKKTDISIFTALLTPTRTRELCGND